MTNPPLNHRVVTMSEAAGEKRPEGDSKTPAGPSSHGSNAGVAPAATPAKPVVKLHIKWILICFVHKHIKSGFLFDNDHF